MMIETIQIAEDVWELTCDEGMFLFYAVGGVLADAETGNEIGVGLANLQEAEECLEYGLAFGG